MVLQQLKWAKIVMRAETGIVAAIEVLLKQSKMDWRVLETLVRMSLKVAEIRVGGMQVQTSWKSDVCLDLKVWEQVLMLIEAENGRKTCDPVRSLRTSQVILKIWPVVEGLDVLGQGERMVQVELLAVLQGE
jgi:hypothetical protein